MIARRASSSGVAALCVLAGCSGPAATSSDAGEPEGGDGDAGIACTLELGTGETALLPLGPEVTVDVINGPQGGQHVWCAARLRGAPEDVYLDLTLQDVSGATLSARQVCVHPEPSASEPGATEIAGIICLLPDPQIVRAPDGGVLRLHVRARGPADRLACGPPPRAACDVSADVTFRATWTP